MLPIYGKNWMHSSRNMIPYPIAITGYELEIVHHLRIYWHFKQELVHIQAAIHEGLRLHPSVPRNIRICLSDDQIPNGPFIRKDDIVRWGDWEMGRRTDLWGEDAREYKLSRWLDEEGNLKRVSPWLFHAFSGGPRVCLGQNLAIFEAASGELHLDLRLG